MNTMSEMTGGTAAAPGAWTQAVPSAEQVLSPAAQALLSAALATHPGETALPSAAPAPSVRDMAHRPIRVTREDFAQARMLLPEDAFGWMVREFAAGLALRRQVPRARTITVDRRRIEVDGRVYPTPARVHWASRPYTFLLSGSLPRVLLQDLLGLFRRG